MGRLVLFLSIAALMISCKGAGPHTLGEPGVELIFMVPGDRILLDNGKQGYVDADGMLVGINNHRLPAAGRKMRDVANELQDLVFFDSYRVIQFGPRYIEAYGAINFPKKYELPLYENWDITNLILKVQGYSDIGKREYLLVRKAWLFPDKHIFVRGISFPVEQGIGGDDLLLFAGDKIFFPGKDNPIYVFGSVRAKKGGVCFTFPDGEGNAPTLKDAIQQVGGLLETADTENIQIFRLLRNNKQSRFKVNLAEQDKFQLESWDVVYIAPKVPKELLK